MFTSLRPLATAMLLIASLGGYAATGLVLAHVATDHVATTDHGDHHDGTEGEQQDVGHGPAHPHQLVSAAPAAPARVARALVVVPLPLAVVHRDGIEVQSQRLARVLVSPTLRAGPPEPKRHSILLV